MWPSKANEAVAPALRSQEGTMAKTDNPEFDGPEVIDRRKLLTAAAAMTAASIVPKVTTAEGVCKSIQSKRSFAASRRIKRVLIKSRMVTATCMSAS